MIVAWVRDKPVAPLKLPRSDSVKIIEIHERSSEEKLVRTIDNTKTIREIIYFVKTHNTDWYKSWNTLPAVEVTVVFQNDEGVTELVLWFGSNWAGGSADGSGSILWRLNENELQELKNKLGINKDYLAQ